MADRCKPGDIAVIIQDNAGCEVNIGRFVHVCGPRRTNPRQGTLWYISPVVGITITYVDSDNTTIVTGPAIDILHEDAWLLPIRPDTLDSQDVQVQAPHPHQAEDAQPKELLPA